MSRTTSLQGTYIRVPISEKTRKSKFNIPNEFIQKTTRRLETIAKKTQLQPLFNPTDTNDTMHNTNNIPEASIINHIS